MSVDVEATIVDTFRLSKLVEAIGEILGQLTGTRPPEVLAIVSRRYVSGVEVEAGSVVESDSPISVGDFSTLSEPDRSVQHFEIELSGLPDRVLGMVVDHTALGWGSIGVSATFSPQRTPVGVLLAVAAALASAALGGGEFVDLNIRFVEPPVPDPRTFVELTRIEGSIQPFTDHALAWVRQFESLQGWPPAE